MIRLQLLGLQHLERAGGESLDAVVAQPKRFAVLAYLAMARGAFVRRDTLLLIFWPELDQFAARRALRNTLYQLRKTLGADVFRTRGDEEVAIATEELWCDVTAFDIAVDEGRFADAAALHAGDLLTGFHLPGGDEEFETWLSEQRRRIDERARRAKKIAPVAVIPEAEMSATAAQSPESAPVAPLAARRNWRLPALVGVAGIALIAIGAVAIWSHRHEPPRRRPRVLITLFENRTGDSTLDPIGDMEVDWLARSVVGSQLLDVIDPRALLARGRTRGGQPEDPGQLAHRTGAALVVTGSYYRSSDSLLFVASVLDGDGRVLRTVGPLAAGIDRPVDGVEATRARVTTALASIVDVRSRADWNVRAAPPPFDAYEPYVAGLDMFGLGEFTKAESLFALAATRDTTFDAANVSVAGAAANLQRCGTVDSVVRSLARRGRSLSELDALNTRIAVARCHGHNDEMWRLTLERARLLSTASPTQYSTANAALWANHPADAVAILGRLNPTVDLDWMPTLDHLDYWASLTEAYHMLGQHDAESDAVDRASLVGLGRFLYRGRAFAALGRSADALSGLDSAFGLPAEQGLSNGMAPNTDGRPEYTGSAAWVGLWVAHELNVHGDSSAGRLAAVRTLAWMDGMSGADRATPEMRLFAAEFLEQAGRTADAARELNRLLADDSSNVDGHGLLAGLAVERGDTALADRLDRWLISLPPERAQWGASFYRARVATLRGHLDDAVALVRQTIALGAWPYWVHADPVLHRLANRPDFVSLTAPRR